MLWLSEGNSAYSPSSVLYREDEVSILTTNECVRVF